MVLLYTGLVEGTGRNEASLPPMRGNRWLSIPDVEWSLFSGVGGLLSLSTYLDKRS